MPDDRGDAAYSQRVEQTQHVLHQVKQVKRSQIAVIPVIPSGGASIASLIGRYDMKTGRRKCRQYPAPAVRNFRETMQQQNARSIRCFESRLEHMHVETVAVVEQTRPDLRLWLAIIGMRVDDCPPMKFRKTRARIVALSHASAKVSTARGSLPGSL